MCECDQSSIFSTGGKFRSEYGLLLELHALTLVTCSYVLLDLVIVNVNDTLPSIKICITLRRNVHSSRYVGGVSNRQTINHM